MPKRPKLDRPRRRLLGRLAKLRRTVDDERRRLELFIEHAPAAIAMFDLQMCYLAASRRWREDYDLPDDVVGRSHYQLFQRDEISEAWRNVHRRALAGEVLSAEEDRFDRADGSAQWVTWEARPWHRASGAIGGIVIAAQDVTERVRARQMIETARREAEEANRAKDTFLAILGHEMRNPLSPIVTALKIMHLRAGEVCERERAIIERQVRHMVRLVDDLLDVSRIAQGKIRLAPERVELADVVAKAIEIAGPMIESTRHEVEVEVPRRGLAVNVDPLRMSQVVSNLLTNAAKYTPRHSRIHVSAQREPGGVVLRVRDEGPGIPADLLPHVFERFRQGRAGSERSQDGLGLGLAIVRSLVEMHGGEVFVESQAGRGSTFTVALPATSLAVDEPDSLDAAPVGAAQGCSTR